jgi:hypothetical protein
MADLGINRQWPRHGTPKDPPPIGAVLPKRRSLRSASFGTKPSPGTRHFVDRPSAELVVLVPMSRRSTKVKEMGSPLIHFHTNGIPAQQEQ